MDERRLAGRLEPREPRKPPRRQNPPTRRQDRAKAIVGKEIDLHRTVAEMLDWAMLPPAMWTTVPGGWGYLPGATAGILKACGYKKGFPDILAFFAFEKSDPGAGIRRDHRSAFKSARLREKRTLPRRERKRA